MGANTKPIAPGAPPPIRGDEVPTPTEHWYLDCLRQWCRDTGRAPSVRELAAWIERSVQPTWSALVNLETKGLVARTARHRFIPAEFVGVVRG